MKMTKDQIQTAYNQYAAAAMQEAMRISSVSAGNAGPHQLLIDNIVREAHRYAQRMIEAQLQVELETK